MINLYLQQVGAVARQLVAALVLVSLVATAAMANEPWRAPVSTAPSSLNPGDEPQRSVRGAVRDANGFPLIGAFVAVIAQGAVQAAAVTVTDASGRFVINDLSPGIYDVVAASLGFAAALVQEVIVPRVEPVSFQLEPEIDRDLASIDLHVDLGWAHRARVRDVLRQTETEIADGSDGTIVASDTLEIEPVPGGWGLDRVELLTLAAFSNAKSSNSTSLALDGLGNSTLWSVEAHLNTGGAIWANTEVASELGRSHKLQVGLGYFGQSAELEGITGEEEFRLPWIGTVYAEDQWGLAAPVNVTAGVRFDHHNFLPGLGLLSPRMEVTYSPFSSTQFVTGIAYEAEALGIDPMDLASDFHPLLGQRNFSMRPANGLTAERAMRYHLGVQQKLGPTAVVHVKAYFDDVSNELLGLYLANPAGGQDYLVFNLGDSAVRGLELGFSGKFFEHLTGEVIYAFGSRGGEPFPLELAGVNGTEGEPLGFDLRHEVQATVGAELGSTSLLAVYHFRGGLPVVRDGKVGEQYGRLDVRFSQPLPFRALDTQWSALVQVRNVIGTEYDGVFNLPLSEITSLSRVLAGGLAVRF